MFHRARAKLKQGRTDNDAFSTVEDGEGVASVKWRAYVDEPLAEAMSPAGLIAELRNQSEFTQMRYFGGGKGGGVKGTNGREMLGSAMNLELIHNLEVEYGCILRVLVEVHRWTATKNNLVYNYWFCMECKMRTHKNNDIVSISLLTFGYLPLSSSDT